MKTTLPILAAVLAALSSCAAVTAPRSRATTTVTKTSAQPTLRGGSIVADDSLRHVVVNKKKAVKKAVAKKATVPTSSGHVEAIVGSLAMVALEQGVKKVFAKYGLKFPTSLGGCVVLFFGLLMMDFVVPGSGKSLYEALGPATALLTKWLPVFFVPGLAMLPLAPSVGSGLEVAKILLITGLGFIYSLFTVAYSVLFLRQAEGKVVAAAPIKKKVSPKKKDPSPAPPKAYSDATMALLAKTTIGTGIASVLVKTVLQMGDSSFATPLQSLFFFSATCATYVWGARLPPGITKTIHPLLTSTALTWGLLFWYGVATNSGDFTAMVKSYKTGTLGVSTAGAGDVLLFLLGPSVVSFAVSMYSRRQLLKENFLIVVASMLVSSLGALFGTAAFAKLIQLGGSSSSALMLKLSMLARNVTTALAIPITQILGGDISIAVVVVVLTGIVGAQYGRRLLDMAGIQDPVTRGLAVGSAAQGLGVSSMVPEGDAFPFAAMAMVLTAVAGTVFVSIPQLKDALVSLCS
ncbi:LrgB family protein [Nitzschia inconspicua]|uniref:LrgB family protein n=1 Tax=Nitzschia inconspicua TaxID=303405 RepID=A0A9K3KHV1_9STRA|nr:LrgB family protein [Nitzschia inconspicua]